MYRNDMNLGINNRLESPYNGYLKGNLFIDLYEPYKNYTPVRLVPNNEQAELLLNLSQLGFATHELRLLLDVYPNDQEKIAKFNEYVMLKNKALLDYESKYGPINWNALSNDNYFSWEATAWPWEMEDK